MENDAIVLNKYLASMKKIMVVCAVFIFSSFNLVAQTFFDITFQVNMCEQITAGSFDPATQAVFVTAGNANQTGNYATCGQAMTDLDGDNVYELTQAYPDGYVINYKFYIGLPSDAGTDNCTGGFEFNLPSPCGVGNFGDREHIVNGSNETLPPVCYGSCNGCTTCSCELLLMGGTTTCNTNTSGPDTYDATFTFSQTTAPGAGTYTLSTTSGGTIGGDDPNLMTSGTIVITNIPEGTDADLNVSDGANCNLYALLNSPVCAPPFDITFQVNMCEQITAGTFDPATQAVFVTAGNANQTGNYASCGQAMTDLDGDNVYELAQTYPDGYVINYKFYIGLPSDAGTDNCTGGFEFNLPSPCGFGFFGDRQHIVSGTNETLPPVCYASCADCKNCSCELILMEGIAFCEVSTGGTNTYTATFSFTQTTSPGPGTYTLTTTSGGTIGGDDPNLMTSGAILITGIPEGTDADLNISDGAECDIDASVSLPDYSFSEVIYAQTEGLPIGISTANPSIDNKVGNGIMLAGTNRYVNRIKFAAYYSPDVQEVPTDLEVSFWSICPGPATPGIGGQCGDNGAILLAKRITTVNPIKSTPVTFNFGIPNPVDLSGLTNDQVHITLANSQSSEILFYYGDENPTIGTRTSGLISACGFDDITNACNILFPNNNIYLELEAVPSPAKPAIVFLSNSGTAAITASDVYIGDSNYGPTQNISVSPNTFTCADIGENEVTLSLTFNDGSTSTFQTTVIVEDITPPIANCKNLTIELVGDNTTITAADLNGNSTDNCGIQSLQLNVEGEAPADFVVLDSSNLGFNMLTLTVTDIHGNVSTCVGVVNIIADLCPGSDGVDSDFGGLPDDCDCSPNDNFNDKIFLKRNVNIGMDFDGLDDHLIIPDAALFNPSGIASIAMEAWIKPDLTREFNTIISKGHGGASQTSYIFGTYNYTNVGLYLSSSSSGGTWFLADSPLTPDVWTHVAVRYNHANSTVTFYYDGQSVKSENVTFTPFSGDTNPVFIGKQGNSCNCNYYKGEMDEVRIFSASNSWSGILYDQEFKGTEPGLLAYYNFNEGVPGGDNSTQTTVKDNSPNGHHASLSGFAQNGPISNWVNNDLTISVINTETLDLCLTCPNTQAVGLDFDGTDSYLEVDYDPEFDPSLSSSFTFEAWVNPDPGTDGQGYRTILSKGNGSGGQTSYIFNISDFQLLGNKLGLYIGDGSQATWIYGNTGVSFNTWSHVAVVYDHVTNTFTFYLNGVADGVVPNPLGFYADTSPLYIGQQGQVCQCNRFDGTMDEVRIWKKAKTAAEIFNEMNQRSYGGESDLILYFNFDNGIPFGENTNLSYIPDVSLNGHEATLYGFTKTGVTSNWVNTIFSLNLPTNAAMNFNFIDDFISIPNDPSLIPTASNAMTFEAWIYPNQSPVANIISASGASPNNNHEISYVGNKIQVTGSGVSPLISAQSLGLFAEWVHITVVFNMDTTKLYINGLLDTMRIDTLAATNLGFPITLGSSVNFNSFTGIMDDVRFWDHARSENQIKEALYQELSGKETGLAAYFNFNNGIPSGDNSAISMVYDVSDNGHDGTLSGFGKMGNLSNWVPSPFNFGDWDKDGTPDFCDNCVFTNDLTLSGNQELNSTFYSSGIILSDQIISSPAAIIYRAVNEIDLQPVFEVELGATFTALMDGCN